MSHDLDALIKSHLGAALPSGLDAQLTSFQQSLSALICTHKGLSAPVDPAKYPGVRYVRLDQDGFTGATTKAALEQALLDTQHLVSELKNAGVTL